MEPSDPFADLADGFHAAALSPDLWPAALQHLSDRVGGAGVFLALENYEGRIKPLGSTRVHPGAAGTYRQNPAGGGVNEARRAVEMASSGAIVPRRAVFDDAVWERSEVYQRLLRPWDLYHVAAAPIVRHATDFVMLTAMRPRRAEDFSGVEQAFLSGALRHLGHEDTRPDHPSTDDNGAIMRLHATIPCLNPGASRALAPALSEWAATSVGRSVAAVPGRQGLPDCDRRPIADCSARGRGARAPDTNSAHRLPSIIAGALVLPALMSGIAERSQTRRFSTPRTRNRESSTAMGSVAGPMRQVPAG